MADQFSNKKILITGGAGFIGSSLAHKLQENYPAANITVFDKFRSDERFESGNFTALGHFKNLIGYNGQLIAGDISKMTDLENVASTKWDYIFHQAAISDTTVMDQHRVLDANSNNFLFFLNLALKNNAHLVYASSAGTYGNSVAPNVVGTGEVPENVYGFSKLLMDRQATIFKNENPDVKVTGLRYFNVYGPREFYKGKTASMILQLGLQILNGQKPKLFKYGEQMRDFVYIDDVIQANIKAVGAASGTYNVGLGQARTFNDIISILGKNLGKIVEVEYIDNPFTFYQNNTCADISNTCEALDYKPEFNLEKGIASYLPEIQRIFNEGL